MLGNMILIFTAVIWGLGFAWQRRGMEDIGPITFTASRELISAVFIGIVAALLSLKSRTSRASMKPDELKEYRSSTVAGGICCGVFLVFATLFQQMGIVYTSAGKAGFITAMYMLMVPVIGFVVFRKKNTWLVWLAVFIGVVGMYLLCITGKFTLSKGDALECVCALLYSCHILCCDRFAPKGDPVTISAIQFAVATVISTILAFVFETPSMDQVMLAIQPILYCGFVSGGMGYTLQIVGQSFTDPTPAALIMSLEAVFAVLGGALMLHERMSGREIAGCVIMFVAIVLVQIPLPGKEDKIANTAVCETDS